MSTSTAAFFRVEGTILSRPTAFTVGWMAANAQEMSGRLARLGALGLSMPLRLSDPGLGRRLQWSALRGMSEDRLVVMGEEVWEEWLSGSVRAIGRDLVARAKRDGRKVVLVSDNLDVVVEHLAKDLQVDDWRANRMEMRNGRSTGRLVDPIVSTLSGTELSSWASEHDVDLTQSAGYGTAVEDAVLLSAVGLPCAVEPDRQLRRMASEHGWPVVNA